VYPTRSGKPKDAQDSTRVHVIPGVFFLTFCQSLDSGFKVIIQQESLVYIYHTQDQLACFLQVLSL